MDVKHAIETIGAHLKAGQYGAVLSVTDEALHDSAGMTPADEAYALACRGVAYRQLGRASEAIACLSEALNIAYTVGDPLLLAETLVDLTAVYAGTPERTKLEELIGQYHRVVRLHPGVAQWDRVYYNLGVCCEWAGDLDEAVKAYRQCIEACGACPDTEKDFAEELLPQALANLGGVLLMQNRPAEALAYLNDARAIMQMEGVPLLLGYEAWYHLLIGNLPEAQTALDQAFGCTGLNDWIGAELHLVQALLRQAEGDIEAMRREAHLAAEHAYRSRPEHVAILHRSRVLIRSLKQEGNAS